MRTSEVQPGVPEGWSTARIGELSGVFGGGKLGLTKASYRPSGFPAFSAAGQDGFVDRHEYAVPGVVLSSIGARCGKCFYAQNFWTTLANVQAILPDTSQLDPKYLWFYVNDERYWHRSGSAQPFIRPSTVKGAWIALPPLPEQRKIAAILSSVDEAIESTQAVIDRLGVVKKAMMSDLLTRGIPGRHQRFKMTEIGEIPEEWEVVKLDAVARRGSGHTPNKHHPEYWDGNVKWVSLRDSAQLDRLYIHDTVAKITPEGIANSSAVEHPAGTVVLSRDAGVGKSAITTDVMAVSQHFMAWVCGPLLDNHYLYFRLQFMKPEFERIAIGNTIKTIGLPYFKLLEVPLPPVGEQREVAAVLKAIEMRLFKEVDLAAGIKAVKSALMSVLLTGEVRVTPAEDAA